MADGPAKKEALRNIAALRGAKSVLRDVKSLIRETPTKRANSTKDDAKRLAERFKTTGELRGYMGNCLLAMARGEITAAELDRSRKAANALSRSTMKAARLNVEQRAYPIGGMPLDASYL